MTDKGNILSSGIGDVFVSGAGSTANVTGTIVEAPTPTVRSEIKNIGEGVVTLASVVQELSDLAFQIRDGDAGDVSEESCPLDAESFDLLGLVEALTLIDKCLDAGRADLREAIDHIKETLGYE